MNSPLTVFLTRLRFKAALPYIRGDVLDLGCGDAEISEWLPGSATSYTGIDSHPLVVAWLQENRPGHSYMCADVSAKDFNLTDTFDTILLLAILEHVSAPIQALVNARDHLTPSGTLILTTPTQIGMSIHTVLARFGLVSRYAAQEHEHAYSEEDLYTLAGNAGLNVNHYQLFLLGGNQLMVCSRPKDQITKS